MEPLERSALMRLFHTEVSHHSMLLIKDRRLIDTCLLPHPGITAVGPNHQLGIKHAPILQLQLRNILLKFDAGAARGVE